MTLRFYSKKIPRIPRIIMNGIVIITVFYENVEIMWIITAQITLISTLNDFKRHEHQAFLSTSNVFSVN